jgi:hypothetical protein
VAFAAFGGFFTFSFNTWFLVKAPAAYFTDNTCLFNLLAEPFQQAFEALAFMNSNLCQLKSTPLFYEYENLPITKWELYILYT